MAFLQILDPCESLDQHFSTAGSLAFDGLDGGTKRIFAENAKDNRCLISREGFRRLCHREDLSYAQLMMGYQHHERLDGKGYPVGIGAEEIHPWARVCAVVDIFEALTSNRPYRVDMPFEKAFEILDRNCEVALDEEIVRCWKTTIQHK